MGGSGCRKRGRGLPGRRAPGPVPGPLPFLRSTLGGFPGPKKGDSAAFLWPRGLRGGGDPVEKRGPTPPSAQTPFDGGPPCCSGQWAPGGVGRGLPPRSKPPSWGARKIKSGGLFSRGKTGGVFLKRGAFGLSQMCPGVGGLNKGGPLPDMKLTAMKRGHIAPPIFWARSIFVFSRGLARCLEARTNFRTKHTLGWFFGDGALKSFP